MENPHIEIFAMIHGYFLRYDGTVKLLDDENIRDAEVRYSLDPVEEFDV